MKRLLIAIPCLLAFSFSVSAQDDFKEYEEGITKFRAQAYGEVIDIFTGILSRPDHSKRLDEDLYFYRGQAYFHQDKYRESLDDLYKSLDLDHYNKGIIHWYIARNQVRLGKKPDAIASYNQALTLAGTNRKNKSRILADRALFYSGEGNADQAKADLNEAIALDPNNKELASLNLNTAPASRTAGEEKKTQLIVKNNPASKQREEPVKNEPVSAEPQQPVKTGLVPPIAEMYKNEKRYALVIGNSVYSQSIGVLKNPVNDATDIATELRQSNFEVQLLTNATYVQIREAMRKFHEKLSNGPPDQTVGLFYYAGHGVQYQDENYLVPVDANVQYEDDIVRTCFPVQRMVLANMERSNSRMNIVILDACRNNPFPATTRSVDQGLAEMKRARGSFIAFATAPGSVASDGVGRNGLYTQELLKALRKPGLTIEQVFKEVRRNVLKLSGEKQYTWDSSNIIGEFYFKF